MKPTTQQFNALQKAFDYFNKHLFSSTLNPVILNFSRHAGAYGFFAPDRWKDKENNSLHEISINPDYTTRPHLDTYGTLVHEMVHLWQEQYGNPSRTGYHNKQWAEKMKSIGLQPDDGNGKETGQKVSHKIIAAASFYIAFMSIPDDHLYEYKARSFTAKEKKAKVAKNKVKYTCPSCNINVWGKPDLNILCNDCNEQLESL